MRACPEDDLNISLTSVLPSSKTLLIDRLKGGVALSRGGGGEPLHPENTQSMNALMIKMDRDD